MKKTIGNKILKSIKSHSVQKGCLFILAVGLTLGLYKYFQFENFFGAFVILPLIIFSGIATLLWKVCRNFPDRRMATGTAVFAGLFALSIIVGSKVNLTEVVPMIFTWRDIIYWLMWTIIAFAGVNVLLQLIGGFNPVVKTPIKATWKFWLIVSGIIFACWLPYFLANFPGTPYADSLDQFSQAIGNSKLSNWHPVLVAGFMAIFAHLGLLLSNGNTMIALALVTLAQMVIMAGVIGYAITWLAHHKIQKKVWLLVGLFFALCPIFPSYAIIPGKDTLFSCALLVFSLKVFDLIKSKGALCKKWQWLIGFTAVTLLVMFLRNNGFYVILFSFIAIVIVFRHYWKILIPIFIGTMTLTLTVQGSIFSAFNIGGTSFTESAGMMFQQIGRTAATSDNFSESERESLSKILPIEKFGEYYNPQTPDDLKFCHSKVDACMNAHELDENKLDFIKTWLTTGLKNPESYITAFLTQNSRFWGTGASEWYVLIPIDNNAQPYGLDLRNINLIDETIGLDIGKKFLSIADKLRRSPVGIFLSMGFAIWPFLLFATLAIIKKRYHLLVAISPAIGAWLTMIVANPEATSFRYALPYYIILPIVVVEIALLLREKQPKPKSSKTL